ncbi:MAG: chromate resistance protein ChrB domain-containing protein [Candidatus Cybelea sp.]
MKFVTRVNARVDRIACPWLVRRFIDPHAEFLFVQPEDVVRVAEAAGAKPFDVPGVELGHRGPECSFDAFIRSYDLSDPALLELARIVRGADTLDRSLTPESAGLFAIASGYRALSPGTYPDDHALLDAEFPIYDALYAYCKGRRA